MFSPRRRTLTYKILSGKKKECSGAAESPWAYIHYRMPVILAPKDFDPWLDPAVPADDAILSLLRPFPADGMTAFPVGLQVNNPNVDRPSCIGPLS